MYTADPSLYFLHDCEYIHLHVYEKAPEDACINVSYMCIHIPNIIYICVELCIKFADRVNTQCMCTCTPEDGPNDLESGNFIEPMF